MPVPAATHRAAPAIHQLGSYIALMTLTLRQLATAAHAALDNCEDLLADARLLFDAGRYPRAHALAVLAVEEFGKSLMCQQALMRDLDVDRAAARYFLRAFRKHETKLRNALLQVDVLPNHRADSDAFGALIGKLLERVEDESTRKLRGLYVDFGPDGSVLVPKEVVGRDAAGALIGDVEELLARMVHLRGSRTLIDQLPPGE
jgi:AbiV family abortive infection protein